MHTLALQSDDNVLDLDRGEGAMAVKPNAKTLTHLMACHLKQTTAASSKISKLLINHVLSGLN